MRRSIALTAAAVWAASLMTVVTFAGTRNCHPVWKCGQPTPIVTQTPVPTLPPTPAPTPSPTAAPIPSATPAPTLNQYTLQDEFDGSALNARWVSLYGPGDPGDRLDTDMGNFGLTQVSVSGGIATIKIERKATPSGRAFAGAIMSTYGTFGQRYGTWEARLRYDEAKGTWPSFFMLPQGQRGPFPEIDVFEAYGDPPCLGPGALVQTEHRATGDNRPKIVLVSNSSGWHVHKIVWASTRLTFAIDGVTTFDITDPAYIPQVAMYPIFVAGVGAPAAGCRADATTPNLLTMQMDYLRIAP